jgi:serine/threonine-protein kinase
VPPGASFSPNVVLKQVPAAKAKGHTGDTITLYVLSPNAQFAVPKLVGDSTEQAAQVLATYGLVLGATTTKACSNTVPIGDVVSSTPGYEALVNSGDQVSLTTSTGYCKVQVPSVIGELQSQAMATLGAAHLSVSVSPTDPSTCSPSQIGFVTDQSLAPSTFVPFNSMITISVCDASTIPPTTTTTL